MKITNLQLLELQRAIQHLSQVNKDGGFPIYDLGYKFNMAMAMAMLKMKVPLETFEGKAAKMRQEIAALRAAADNEKSPPEKRDDALARTAVVEVEWRALLAETVDVDLPTPVSGSDIQCKGMTPTPEILAMLSPLFA